jgi:hypothetical protein
LRGRVRDRVLDNSFFHPPLHPLPSREGIRGGVSLKGRDDIFFDFDALRSLPQGSSLLTSKLLHGTVYT